MLPLNVLLLPMVIAATGEVKIDDYIVKIANRTLLNVRMTETPSSESLDLSGLGLKGIDSMAFVNVTHARYLDLGNNSITDLPESVFSKLHYLKGLSLADNNIKRFTGAFGGLKNLRSLDISNNPVRSLEPGELYGLTESVVISTLGNSFERLSTSVFQEPPENSQPAVKPNFGLFHGPDLKTIESGIVDGPLTTDATEGIKICIERGKVILLENWSKDEVLSAGCSKVKHSNFGALYMDDLGIVEFARGWYRITDRYIERLTFRRNRIEILSTQILNDLPESIIHVDLSENKIERLTAGVIRNSNIQSLYLKDNLIRKIEQSVFENMAELEELRLSGNKLKDTIFVATLPSGLGSLHLDRNEIEDITNFSTARHFRLGMLRLNHNNIRRLRVNSFPLQMVSLYYLDLSDNHITTLPPLSFRGVLGLLHLRLRNNGISHIFIGAFSGLSRLVELNLGGNRIKNIESFAHTLPNSLDQLFLDNNVIEELRAGSFVNVPKQLLDLGGNKISKIAKNSFIVPGIYGKDSETEQPSWQQALNPWWWHDSFAIALSPPGTYPEREKGIGTVNLSRNPISKLENGGLFGIRLGRDNYIYTSTTRIDSIQGGVFADTE